MLQDLYPQIYYPEFTPRCAHDNDYVLLFSDDYVVLENKSSGVQVPQYATMAKYIEDLADNLVYLFSVDEHAFFLLLSSFIPETPKLTLEPVSLFRTFEPRWQAFAGITGKHLHNWYQAHRFCGACGGNFVHSSEQRSLICAQCGFVDFPKISPVVIVGVTDGDKLLMTRFARGPYKKYALVSGYVEVGETLEDAVRREVLEEVGLRVTNIRYYKSQPWAFSGSLLAGFYADVEGSRKIVLDTNELVEGLWMTRANITTKNPNFDINNISLTSEMIASFYNRTFPR